MPITVVSYPSTLVVTVNELKSHARIDESADDALIEFHLRAATEYCEDYCHINFITADLKRTLDSWCSKIKLPKPPLVSVTNVQYVDQDGITQTWNSSNYSVLNVGIPRVAGIVYSTTAPSYKDVPQAIWINFKAGFGTTAATVPNRIKQAIRLLAAHWYEQREAVGTVTGQVAFSVHALLDQFKFETFSEV
jgi:uncharacterized phiE125 gp8 family phage protein